MDKKTGKWIDEHHFVKIGRERKMLFKEIMKTGKPREIYSTSVTKTPDNKDMKVGVPVHLAGFPEDY